MLYSVYCVIIGHPRDFVLHTVTGVGNWLHA